MAYSPVADIIEDDEDWLERPSQGGASDPLVNQEFTRLSNKFSDAGYREGITDGKLVTLQQGFDEGFASSVPLSRRVGILRGQAAALLAISTSTSSTASTSHASNDFVESIRDIIRQLGVLKSDEVLPVDQERIDHEKEEHPDGEEFELDQNDKRDMEGLEKSLGLMGSQSTTTSMDEKEDGESVVNRLEEKVAELEKLVLRR
ncbi:uncharacterized protein IL334_001737 [Kwoniella shivajii]|uniref:Protein YAE1 n=1 Tax=Kwoniella shivajii TaxID=564305 RepID=A0ABZ1CTX8_9TREE|nr:hypothetical protein IL334_001737 [Kwoniella shivajii]